MKFTYILSLVLIFSSCASKNNSALVDEAGKIVQPTSLIDSLINICRINTIDTFDITTLQTDTFDEMTPVSEDLFHNIYPDRYDFPLNSIFIYSYIPLSTNYLTLILYEKNFEGENYRVDYIDMVNIDSVGRALDKIRLTAKDNAVVTYEVVSFFTGVDTLTINEIFSSEPYFNPDRDTLYTNLFVLKLNGTRRFDTISIDSKVEVRFF